MRTPSRFWFLVSGGTALLTLGLSWLQTGAAEDGYVREGQQQWTFGTTKEARKNNLSNNVAWR
jgi:hypothetical protein